MYVSFMSLNMLLDWEEFRFVLKISSFNQPQHMNVNKSFGKHCKEERNEYIQDLSRQLLVLEAGLKCVFSSPIMIHTDTTHKKTGKI